MTRFGKIPGALCAALLVVHSTPHEAFAAGNARWKAKFTHRGLTGGGSSGSIVEGPGCSGASTPTGSQFGDSGDRGYSSAAMATWTAVPDEHLTTTRSIGVLAYHVPTATEYTAGTKNNISYVSFILDCGTPLQVSSKTYDATTNVTAYHVSINPGLLTAKAHVLDAIAYPATGQPSVIRTTFDTGNHANYAGALLYVAASGGVDTGNCTTQGSPCATIRYAKERLRTTLGAQGSVIELTQCGTYNYGGSVASESFSLSASGVWMTIRGAANLDKSCVILATGTSSNGLNVTSVRLKNLTIGPDTIIRSAGSGTASRIWLDGVDYTGSSNATSNMFATGTWTAGRYLTDVNWSTSKGGPQGGVILGRNVNALNIAEEDIINSRGGSTYINFTGTCSASTGGGHVDGFQNNKNSVGNPAFDIFLENVNLSGTCQIFYSDAAAEWTNLVVSNSFFDNYGTPYASGGSPAMQMTSPSVNVYWYNNTWSGNSRFRPSTTAPPNNSFTAANFFIIDNSFTNGGCAGLTGVSGIELINSGSCP